MDDASTFQSVLSQYEQAYADFKLGLTDQRPLRELQVSIQNKLLQLREQTTNESREISTFSTTFPNEQKMTEAMAKSARSLQSQTEYETDEATRAQRMLQSLNTAPPPVDYRPLGYRLGGIAGLLVLLAIMRRPS